MVYLTDHGWRFELICPRAGRAYLVGDFGEGPVTLQMTDAGDGCFVATVDPPPGEYRFRYRADDEWVVDFAAFGVARRDDGGFDSVMYVPPADAPVVTRRPWASTGTSRFDVHHR